MKNKINSKSILKTISIILYTLTMITYEFLYCNGEFSIGLINSNFTNFNFSLARIVCYIILGYVFIKFINKNIDTALESLKNKYKIIVLVAFVLIFLIATPYAIYENFGFYKMVLLILDFLMGATLLIYISNDFIKNISIIFLTVGILFCCTTQFNGSLDEKRHFMSAYNISIGNLKYKSNNISEKSIEQIPKVCPMEDSMKFFSIKYENKQFENNDTDMNSKPASYNFIIYLPSAIGINFARILQGSVADIYIIGRIFNLLAYTLMIIGTLKLLPFKKNVFFITYITPMLLLLAGSYSIDGICVGLVGLFIAYCLKIYNSKEKISTRQIVILGILFSLSLLAKEMSHMFISILLLLLPVSKIIKENKKTMLIVTLSVIGVMLIILKTSIFTSDSTFISDPRNENTSIKGQVEFILKNPITDVFIGINHIKGTLLNWNWLNYINPIEFFGKASNLFVLQTILLLYVAISDNSYKFNIKEKIIIGISFLAVYATGSVMLYLSFTPVGNLTIEGYQTRYLFPILPLLLMIMNNNNKEDKNFKEKISIISALFIIVDIIGLISRI